MTSKPVTAICPGSFDPLTRGHEDIIRRTLSFADRVIVAVAETATQSKRGRFTVPERIGLIRSVFQDQPRVEATSFAGLLVEFARQREAHLIVRGLRAISDFEYELQMAQMNHALNAEIETVFLTPAAEFAFLSSSLVREVAALGGDVGPFVSPPVLEALRGPGNP